LVEAYMGGRDGRARVPIGFSMYEASCTNVGLLYCTFNSG